MCKYCDKPENLKSNEKVVYGMYAFNLLPSFLQTKFIYCPMCGKKLGGTNEKY